jgi:hypothetical protein
VTIDAQIGPFKESERSLFLKYFGQLKKRYLVLGDRNYPSKEMMLRIVNQGVHYCFRVKEKENEVVSKFVVSGAKQQIVSIPLSKKALSFEKEKNPSSTIACRLIRIALENGDIKLLATSLLDEEHYEYDQFEAPYHTRWNVEEEYKLLKSRIEIEAFSGRTSRSI